ncbi:transmembrane protein 218-like [Copidosoma floridanum]|uniref:transmembrane protein 218-like n=1 Tax=Copidosoma floridanum TaxID=29053 RepID=UPI0006C98F40|nr:transmembrane protein 218-like [Copidosoma floridanum]
MTNHTFGLGLGLFVLLIIWVLAGLVFLVSLRIEQRIGAVALAVAAIITIVLVSVPRAPEHPVPHENKPYDHFFIWRLITTILLGASAVVAIVSYFKLGLMEVARPQRIKNWVF